MKNEIPLLDLAVNFYLQGKDVQAVKNAFHREIIEKKNYDAVEYCLEELIKLHSENLNLQRSLAHTKMLNNNLSGAVKLFDRMIQNNQESFDVLMQFYVYSGLLQGYFDEQIKEKLKLLDSSRAEMFFNVFEEVELVRKSPVITELSTITHPHSFVLLGFALDEFGNMAPELLARLELALRLLELNPTSNIILSGGLPKNGYSETQVMKSWLLERGIDKLRLIEEGTSTDTIENALNSMNILEVASNVTLVTSSSHARRAQVMFRMADTNRHIKTIGTLEDYLNNHQSTELEGLEIYRDVLRMGGIWGYPGIMR